MSWQALGGIGPEALAPARLALHRAVQLAACPGHSLLPRQPDDGQMALGWTQGTFLGAPLPGGYRVGLRCAGLELEVADLDGATAARLPLEGRTPGQGLQWLRRQLADLGVPSGPLRLDMHFEIPAPPAGNGSTFDGGSAQGRGELARWYSNTVFLLDALVNRKGASPIRCWPHHFDLAILLVLDGDAEPERARSVGVGLSPGDGSYPEPYFYATPWPYPTDRELDRLPLGHWHTEGWVGAVFPAEDLLRGPVEGQQARAETFLSAAVAACEDALD